MRFSRVIISSFVIFALSACGTDNGGGASGSSGSGSGGTGSGGTGGGSSSTTIPADLTEASFTSFIANGDYQANGWISETAAPRDASSTVSPHGRVRVWFNPELVQSQKAAPSLVDADYVANSMAVKELYDDADQLVGQAAFLKVDENQGPGAWQYYCKGPDGRCYTSSSGLETTPLFTKGGIMCGGCHGGIVITAAP